MTREPFTGWDLDPDPLVAPADEPPPPRRSGCLSVLPWLALLLAIALGIVVPTPSEGPNIGSRMGGRVQSAGTTSALRGAPVDSALAQLAERRVWDFPDAEVAEAESARGANAGAPTGSVGAALLGGWISWADPDLGGDYLATRFPRGTLVRLCTPNRCIVRRSNDFGPSAKIDPPRIADLAVLDWEQLCGLPRARGVCRGTVETIDEIALPATDTEEP